MEDGKRDPDCYREEDVGQGKFDNAGEFAYIVGLQQGEQRIRSKDERPLKYSYFIPSFDSPRMLRRWADGRPPLPLCGKEGEETFFENTHFYPLFSMIEWVIFYT